MTNSWLEIADKELWEKSLLSKKEASFLQAFAFGEFHRFLGNKIWRFGKMGGSNLSGLCLVIKVPSKLGSFLYVPGGPFIDNWEKDFPSLVSLLTALGKEEAVSFIRLDPRVIATHQLTLLQQAGLIEAPTFTQPQCTLILDLESEITSLRRGLRESTRYNIGWVARQGVEVKVSQNTSEIEAFISLLKETAHRHKLRLVDNLDYYREQFLSFEKAGQAKLYLSYAPKETNSIILAAAIVIYFGETVTYLHAASSSQAPKLRAPYLMQWKIIEDAKELGFKYYDFWGVAPTDDPTDPWAGVTSFKRSFGGRQLCYEKPWDLVLNKSYYLLNFSERLRKLVRRWC
jgi:lipid II:glycine glycyltransferase (peptidoglycan interpeptide bridge formation enzyme)